MDGSPGAGTEANFTRFETTMKALKSISPQWKKVRIPQCGHIIELRTSTLDDAARDRQSIKVDCRKCQEIYTITPSGL